ncbi:ATP-binding protein [Pedobacter sp. Leaf176]|uniref:ATP-binding protein n=1 Tax=Pedobacter sp. Leaf176 TaxID=1736286 RepID=UPI0006FAD984|nr:ATP-binding protein [Pedobacter sp. Leaf176]KQR70148.1 hypothetical protein ASF92_09095 [Pedobacter sp. Leaf176]
MNTYSHSIHNLIPGDDQQRVKALERYQIFNELPEPVFDRICELACTMFQLPIAHISFLDATTELVKSSVGLGNEVISVPRTTSLCAIAVLNNSLTVIPDATKDDRIVGHPYVYGEFGLRFYAGAPIRSRDGHMVGTMCLLDRKVRTLSERETEILIQLAGVVSEQLELRLQNLENELEQKAANSKLFESEQRLVSTLDTMADGVCIVDAAGNTTYINHMAQRIFGVDLESMRQRKYNDEKWLNVHLDGRIMQEEEHPLYIMLKSAIPLYDQEIGISRPGEEILYISVNLAPLFNEQHELSGGVCTFTDVTARRKLMKEKDEFISIASHELKTPITSLKGSLQLMDRIKSDLSSPVFPKLIDQANKSMDKLNELVVNLLHANNIAAGELKLVKTTFTIDEVIDQCCDQVRLSGVYQILITGDRNLQLHADEHRIEQVVVNLVDNAIKYAPESKVVEINITRCDDMVRISVTDQGVGVASEKIPHLFDRYYRAGYKGLHYSGLGLGLYISAGIIRKHGGEIGVESTKGQGATFWFTIPLDL